MPCKPVMSLTTSFRKHHTIVHEVQAAYQKLSDSTTGRSKEKFTVCEHDGTCTGAEPQTQHISNLTVRLDPGSDNDDDICEDQRASRRN